MDKRVRLAQAVINTSLAMKEGDFLVITSDNKESDLPFADALYREARNIGADAGTSCGGWGADGFSDSALLCTPGSPGCFSWTETGGISGAL